MSHVKDKSVVVISHFVDELYYIQQTFQENVVFCYSVFSYKISCFYFAFHAIHVQSFRKRLFQFFFLFEFYLRKIFNPDVGTLL